MMSETVELKLYSPLQVDIIDRDRSGHPIPLQAVSCEQGGEYLGKIMNAFRELQSQEDARNAFIASEQDWSEICEKIISLTRTVEAVNGTLYGVYTCRSSDALDLGETEDLKWYGYRNAGNGGLEIVPEEAEVIRWVFDLYPNGYSPTRIAEEMNRRGIRKKYGKAKWTKISVVHWLENEKYTGNTLCQKTFKTGFPYATVKNQGEMDQFYIENCHPAIISREVFDRVQTLRQHKRICPVEPTQYPLTRKMVCGACGATLYRNVSSSGNATWICSQHMRVAAACSTKPIWERDVYTGFIRMYNKLRLHEGIVLWPALDQMEALETAVQRENPAMLEINRAIAQATEQNYKISKLRTSGLLDADACAAKLAALDAQLTQFRVKRRRLLRNDDISEVAEMLRQTMDAGSSIRCSNHPLRDSL